MVRTISDDALDVIGTGANYSTTLTVTVPGEEPVDVEHTTGWSVDENAAVSGTRLSVSSLQLLPSNGVDDLFAFAGAPGAVYDLWIGINLGSTIEDIQVFHGHAAEGSAVRNSLGVKVALTDPWEWVNGAAFTTPLATGIATRASLIEDIVVDVIPELNVIISADGSTICQSGVYTNTRGEAVTQLADDGLLSVGFNGQGDFTIRARRDLENNLTPDWFFRTDQDLGLNVPAAPTAPATIIAGTLERTRPWGKSLFNRVTVQPGGDWQTWKAQTARLDDETHPAYEDAVGVRELVLTSNTIGNAYDAWRLAQAELTRRLRITDERVKFDVVLNPAIEAEDVGYVAALPTVDDAGWNGTYIIMSAVHAPSEGVTHIEAISASGYSLGT
jgi:hypothetical protein